MNGPQVRPAEERDLPAVVALERGLPTAPHWGKARYLEIVRGESPVPRCLLVVEEPGHLIGFAVGRVAADEGELETVAVDAAHQGLGLGRSLVCAVIDWCRVHGARELLLEVRAGSAGALHLYQQLGFERSGQRSGYYTHPPEDAVLMRLRIASGYGPQGQESTPGDV